MRYVLVAVVVVVVEELQVAAAQVELRGDGH
jgi:hypothetical protein